MSLDNVSNVAVTIERLLNALPSALDNLFLSVLRLFISPINVSQYVYFSISFISLSNSVMTFLTLSNNFLTSSYLINCFICSISALSCWAIASFETDESLAELFQVFNVCWSSLFPFGLTLLAIISNRFLKSSRYPFASINLSL